MGWMSLNDWLEDNHQGPKLWLQPGSWTAGEGESRGDTGDTWSFPWPLGTWLERAVGW